MTIEYSSIQKYNYFVCYTPEQGIVKQKQYLLICNTSYNNELKSSYQRYGKDVFKTSYIFQT